MNITFLLPKYPWKPVGGFRVVYEYANHLTMRGHKITIIHPRRLRKKMPPLGTLVRDFFLVPKVKWQYIDPRINLAYTPNLDEKYIPDGDIIFATAWQTAEYVLAYKKSKGDKFYLIQHYETMYGPKDKIDLTWLAPLKKVVIAKWLYEKGLELGVSPNEMVHIPNGLDLQKFKLINSIESRPLRVAMLYHKAEFKGSLDGIKALQIIKEKFPHLKAVLFGTPPRPPILPKWIEYYQKPSQDRLVADIYNGSSIYLSPSWTEGWGLPSAEAMACGCAVVSADNGGIRDFGVPGKTVLLAPVKSPQILAEQVITLIKDEQLRISIAKAGHENIQKFTWDKATDKLESFIVNSINSTVT